MFIKKYPSSLSDRFLNEVTSLPVHSITETVETIGKRNSVVIDTHYLKQREALNTALPIGVRQVHTMRTMLTQSLAVFLPFNVQEISDDGGFYYGINQISKNVNIANRKKLLNGNGFVFGVPGSGKSFFCKQEMGQVFLNSNDDVMSYNDNKKQVEKEVSGRYADTWMIYG